MSKKRFIDAMIWDKPWFRKLDAEDKLLWFYMISKCDHAGVFIYDEDLFKFQLGVNSVNLEVFKSKIIQCDDDKYFIKDFPNFQYGTLHFNSAVHKSCVKRLVQVDMLQHTSNQIDSSDIKAIANPLVSPKDKDKIKGKANRQGQTVYTTKEIPF